MFRRSAAANNEADQATQRIITNINPPVSAQRAIATIQPPSETDYYSCIETVLKRDSNAEINDEKINIIYKCLTSNIRKSLVEICVRNLTQAKQAAEAFIGDEADDPRDETYIKTYRGQFKKSLHENLEQLLNGVKKAVDADMKSLDSDGLQKSVGETIQKYLQARHGALLIYQNLAAAIYNGAVDYYKTRWQASHDDINKLRNEVVAINTIFDGIIRINDDFTITSSEETLNQIVIDPEKLQVKINDILQRAYNNKLDNNKTAYTLLITNLNDVADLDNGTSIFTPVNLNDTRPALKFQPHVHEIFKLYFPLKSQFDSLTPETFNSLIESVEFTINHMSELTKAIETSIREDLEKADRNIEALRRLHREEIEILRANSDCRKLIEPVNKSISRLNPPTQTIINLDLPQQLTESLRDLYEKRLNQKPELLQAVEDILKQLSSLDEKMKSALIEADKTATTLEPIAADAYIDDISRTLEEIKTDIERLQQSADQAIKYQDLSSSLLDLLQRAKNADAVAVQYYAGLREGNKDNEYFTRQNNAQYPFSDNALARIDDLKSHKYFRLLPDDVKQYIDKKKANLIRIQLDSEAILRCHLLLNSLLNFNYWRYCFDKRIQIIADNKTYSIPQTIYDMIDLARQPNTLNWAINSDHARNLLIAFQQHAANTSTKNGKMRSFLAEAAKGLNAPVNIGGRNGAPAKMFFQPQRLINPQEIQFIRKGPTFRERHPVAIPVLKGLAIGFMVAVGIIAVTTIIGGAIILSGGTAAFAIAGAIATASAYVGGPAAFFTLCTLGVTAICTGIGALAGRIKGKRHESQLNQQAADQRQIAENNASKVGFRKPMPTFKPQPVNDKEAGLSVTSKPQQRQSRDSQPSTSCFTQFTLAQLAKEPVELNKAQFEEALVNEIINTYSASAGSSKPNPAVREKLVQEWRSARSLDAYLTKVETDRTATGASVIQAAIDKLSNTYAAILNSYPEDSVLKQKYYKTTQAPRAGRR
jgi:hypothetical protein